jgi:hypothetical protein
VCSVGQLEIESGIRVVLNLKSIANNRRLGLVREFEIRSLLIILIFYNKKGKNSHNQKPEDGSSINIRKLVGYGVKGKLIKWKYSTMF